MIDLDKILQQQETLWRANRPIDVEQLAQSQLGDDYATVLESEQWLELICNEVSLREMRGEHPTLEEYQKRFPRLSESLKIQWEIDELLQHEHGEHALSTHYRSMSIRQTRTDNRTPIKNTTGGFSGQRYVLGPEIGRGAIGIVFEGWDPQLKRQIAIKRMRSGMDTQPEDLIRLRSEAEAIAKVQSEHIVQIYDVGELDGEPYLAMEYCKGGSLASRIGGKPLPPMDAARIAEGIAKGTAAAHACRVIHRDLKPSNILLSDKDSWSPKIADFGLAKLMDSDSTATATGSILGTPAYMAPEQAFGDAKYAGPAVDIYAIGAILYECLTGRPPFLGKTIVETLDQVRHGSPIGPRRLQSTVPRDLEAITLTCLAKEPFNRYATAQELADDLGCFLRNAPVTARHDSRLKVCARVFRRNPVTCSLAATTALMLLVASVVSLLFAQHINFARIKAIAMQLESEKQRDTAMRARNRTREALDAMTSTLAATAITEQQSATPEQKRFLRDVLSYYNEFIDDPEQDEKSAELAAEAATRVASIQHLLGDKESSKVAYEKAVEHFQRLVDRYPDRATYADELRTSLNNLAAACSNFGERQRSVELYERGLSLYDNANESQVSDPQFLLTHAVLQHNLALQYRDQSRHTECKSMLENALKTFASISELWPSFERHQRNYAMAEGCLGIEESVRGDWQRGRKLFVAACDRLKYHVADPNSLACKGSLGWCLNHLGMYLSQYDETDEAASIFKEAIETLESLSLRAPSAAQYGLDLAGSRVLFAKLLMNNDMLTDARQQADQALQVLKHFEAENPNSNDFLWALGETFELKASIELKSNRFAEAGGLFQRCMDSWLAMEANRSSSAEFYDPHLEAFRRAAAVASGLVPNKSQEYWGIAMRLNERQFTGEAFEQRRLEEFCFLLCSKISGYIQRGALEEAVPFASELREKAGTNADALYNGACAYSLVANAFVDGDQRRQKYIACALEMLNASSDAGWVDGRHAEMDPDLKPLHTMPDFHSWIARLRKLASRL